MPGSNRSRKRAEAEEIRVNRPVRGSPALHDFHSWQSRDWKGGRQDGTNFLIRTVAGVADSPYRDNVKLLPAERLSGPGEVPLSDQVVLIVIDTQWWLHPWDKPEGETSLWL